MEFKNKEGGIDLKHEEEIDKLIDKIIKTHNPINSIEFQALYSYIVMYIGYKISLVDAQRRSKL